MVKCDTKERAAHGSGCHTGALYKSHSPNIDEVRKPVGFSPDVECYSCEKNGSSYPLTSWANIAKRFNYVAAWQPYAGPEASTTMTPSR